MSADPDEQRAEQRERWDRSAPGWGARADHVGRFGFRVAQRMLDAAALQPGYTVLELAAGPGEVGFLAAELIQPGGKLISSDGAPGMVEVARQRAAELGLTNTEHRELELEWIDLPTAAVEVVLCRWGLMFAVDTESAVREIRRVLRPRGRAVLATWAPADANPWMAAPSRVLIDLGHSEPPPPDSLGPFRLSDPIALAELLRGAGFAEVAVEAVDFTASYPSIEDYLEITRDLSRNFDDISKRLDEPARAEVDAGVREALAQYIGPDGRVDTPARALVATGTA